MAASEMETVQNIWPSLAKVLFVPHSEQEYGRLVAILDELIDLVGEDEFHPLASYMEIISVLIEKFEDEHVPEITDLQP